MERLPESPVGASSFCGLVFYPPGREATVLAGLVEEDDVPVGVTKPRLAPHPRLVAGPVLERDAAAGELLDAFVQVVAFKIDCAGRNDLFVGIDLDREGDAAGRFEAGVTRLRAVDDLPEPDPPVEIDRSLVIRAGDGDLVEARPRTDVEPDTGMAERSGTLPKPRRIAERYSDELARPRHRVGKARTFGEEQGDRARKRAARAVGAGGVDTLALPAGHIVSFDERVGEGIALFMATLNQDGTAVRADQVKRGGNRILLGRQPIELRKVGSRDCGDVHQSPERGDRRIIGERRAAGRDHDGIEDDRKARLLGLQPFEALGDLLGGKGATDHPDLYRIDSDVTDNRFDLREDHLGRDRMNGTDTDSVLRSDGGDRSHRVTAKHGDGLDVGLNPGASARIRAGDNQDPSRRRHATRLRPRLRGEVVHVHGFVLWATNPKKRFTPPSGRPRKYRPRGARPAPDRRPRPSPGSAARFRT